MALKCTKAYPHPSHHAFFIIDDYFELVTGPIQSSKYMFMLAGVYLVTAVYFFFVFANQPRDYSTLIFSVICLVFTALVLMEYLKLFYLYPYPFQRTRLEIIGDLHLLLSLLVPWFLILQFKFPWKKSLMGLWVLVIIYVEISSKGSFDSTARSHNLLMEICSFIIVGYACWKQTKGAYVVLAAFLLSLVLTFLTPDFNFAYVSHFDVMLFISFTLIVLSNVICLDYSKARGATGLSSLSHFIGALEK